MRLIDADKTYKILTDYYHHNKDVQHIALTLALNKVPTVDAEPVRHGRWERKEDPYGFFDTIPVCSACGCTTKYRETSAYCPHCGALMDEVT